MDEFDRFVGPSAKERKRIIANDPYAAAKFFQFIIRTTLETLFRIESSRQQVHHEMGILGLVEAYIGVMESQNRGALHAHMMVWLENAPSPDDMRTLLQSAEFRERVKAYIEHNIHAHLPGMDQTGVKNMEAEKDLAYSRPPNPDSPDFKAKFDDMERRLMRSQQIHTCRRNVCLKMDWKTGRMVCKRRAPWKLTDDNVVDDQGNWYPKRTYGFVNNYNPNILVSLRCNHDIKILTNGEDTKNVTWYITKYATKNQQKLSNISALLAKGLAFHFQDEKYIDSIRDRSRLMVFRCFHTLNRNVEQSGPQVISYLMGWGDSFKSHNYVPLFWSSMASYLRRKCPELNMASR